MLFVPHEQLPAGVSRADEAFEQALENVRERVAARKQFALIHERIADVPTLAFQSREGWASRSCSSPTSWCASSAIATAWCSRRCVTSSSCLPLDVEREFAHYLLDEFAAVDMNALDIPPLALVDGHLSPRRRRAHASLRRAAPRQLGPRYSIDAIFAPVGMTRHQRFDVRLAPDVAKQIATMARRAGTLHGRSTTYQGSAPGSLMRWALVQEARRSCDHWSYGSFAPVDTACSSHWYRVRQRSQSERWSRRTQGGSGWQDSSPSSAGSICGATASARPDEVGRPRAELATTPGFKEGFDALYPYLDVSLEIGALRAELDMTQSEFGRLVGVPQSTVARLESGKQTPSVAMLKRIAIATGIGAGDRVPAIQRPADTRRRARSTSSAAVRRQAEPVVVAPVSADGVKSEVST